MLNNKTTAILDCYVNASIYSTFSLLSVILLPNTNVRDVKSFQHAGKPYRLASKIIA